MFQPSGITIAACFSLVVHYLVCFFAHVAPDPICRVVLFTITRLSSFAHQTVCSVAASPPERLTFRILSHGLAGPLPRHNPHVCTLLKFVTDFLEFCRQPSGCWIQDRGGSSQVPQPTCFSKWVGRTSPQKSNISTLEVCFSVKKNSTSKSSTELEPVIHDLQILPI